MASKRVVVDFRKFQRAMQRSRPQLAERRNDRRDRSSAVLALQLHVAAFLVDDNKAESGDRVRHA